MSMTTNITPPLPAASCLSPSPKMLMISTFGAFGPDALALLRTLSRRSGRTVPPSLLEEASWATPVFASFARMSLSLSMRRSLAYRLREAGVTESAARVLARQPAPVPEDPDRAFDAPESG